MLNASSFSDGFSSPRVQKYIDYHKDDFQKALLHYEFNIKLSESFYPCLSVLEVTLRNAFNKQLTGTWGERWYENQGLLLAMEKKDGKEKFQNKIKEACKKVRDGKDCSPIFPPKIIAALGFGFWTMLLEDRYKSVLWQSIGLAFMINPPVTKYPNRSEIFQELDKIRKFRNRIAHHEPILWDLGTASKNYSAIIKMTNILHPDIATWVDSFCRVNSLLSEVEKAKIVR